MRILRFAYGGKAHWGLLKNGTVTFLRDDHPFGRIRPLAKSAPLEKVRLLAPALPTKIICVGLNYRDHARELDMRIPSEPVVFLKPPTAIIAHGEAIVYPHGVAQLDYEAELACVIKKKARGVPRDKADEYILGYTCLNDVTARDLQRKDVQWTRAKSFDTFCPLGPWVETDLDPANLKVVCRLNGRIRQDSSTSNLIFPVGRLVSFISSIMTLNAGDVIATGTPAGVGPMKRGDTVEVEIGGIGVLKNRVAVPAPLDRSP